MDGWKKGSGTQSHLHLDSVSSVFSVVNPVCLQRLGCASSSPNENVVVCVTNHA
jgi:hypothetical protein